MSWADLEPILRRAGVWRDAPHLIAPLRAASTATRPVARRRALAEASAILGTDGRAGPLLRALAASGEPTAGRLALELVARLPVAPEAELLHFLRRLLRERRIPATVRLAGAVALTRTVPSADASQVLRAFAAGFGRARFLNRRAILRKRFSHRKRLFDRYADRLAARLPLRCPRCRTTVPRDEMARHLWERHRCLLVGRNTVTPWRLIDRWVSAAGPVHAHRELLRHGGPDEDSLAALRRDAGRKQAGVCPRCFAEVRLDPTVAPAAEDVKRLTLSHGRFAGFGYVVGISRHRFAWRLRIETPDGVIFDGVEPGPPPKPGWRRVVPIPLALGAIAVALTLPEHSVLPFTVIALLAMGWLSAGLRAGEPDDRPDRVVDHAWRLLVPHLHADDFDGADADFVAALAVSSVDRGDPALRSRHLRRLIDRTASAVRSRSARPTHLVALQRLQVADAEIEEGDAVRTLADAAAFWFTTGIAPSAADLLLTDDLMAAWTRGQRARLRVLLAARVFEAGMGVWDLHALGRAVPRFGHVIAHEDTDGLARLRMLWDLRPVRPWQRCGPAATVFELAKYPMLGSQHLEAAPDLLLFQPLPAGGEPLHLLACGRGLIVGGALIHEWPTSIETRPLPVSKGGGYELRFGGHSVQIHGDPDEVAGKVAAWATYLFEEFLPWIGNVLTRPDSRLSGGLGAMIVRCPECGTAFAARRGDVGRAIQPGGG